MVCTNENPEALTPPTTCSRTAFSRLHMSASRLNNRIVPRGWATLDPKNMLWPIKIKHAWPIKTKTAQAPPRKRRLVTYTMQPLNEQPGHRFGVNRILRLGEDSLLSAGRDGVVRRWDVSSMLDQAGGRAGSGRRDDGENELFSRPVDTVAHVSGGGGLCPVSS